MGVVIWVLVFHAGPYAVSEAKHFRGDKNTILGESNSCNVLKAAKFSLQICIKLES